MTLTLNWLFWLVGIVLLIEGGMIVVDDDTCMVELARYGIVLLIVGGMFVVDRAHPRRFTAGGFWLLYALIFLIGDRLPAEVVGVLVLAMALIAGCGGVTAAKPKVLALETRMASAKRLGNKLFVPALTIPVITVALTLAASHLVFGGTPLIDPKNVTLARRALVHFD